MAFHELMESNALPPPPPELEGQPLEVELLGILAQAQRAVQTNGLDRFFTGVLTAAQLDPTAGDKVNVDEAVEVYADSYGIDPKILRDEKDVDAIRQNRAAQQAAAAKSAQAAEGAKAVQGLGGVPTKGGASNAGADVIGMFSGYNNPQAERTLPGT
jgi:hypothetical protein